MESRPDPDALLARVHTDAAKAARGRLKIFFGMAPGVGKTYAMLEAARKVGKEGVDVVVGYVEPHARPETQALVLGLDVLPRKAVEQRGATLQEFDLTAAIARRPQLILVDELAHTNAEGMTHPKRWQDVEDLLVAGISVYATLNVQHIESLNDVVAQVTGVAVRETVPDHVFEQADEVELVDIAPDDLVERLREGKVYVPQQAQRALENFFRKGNLIALRELALRKTAERVSAQALDYRQEHDVTEIWRTGERLLVCVGASPMSAQLVRAARRMAAGLRAPWIALHVESDRAAAPSAADEQRLAQNLRLAEELGAQVEVASGADFAETVLEYARARNITKLIVGKPLQSWWRELVRGSFVYRLIRQCGDIDVYVIGGKDAEVAPNAIAPATRPTRWADYLPAVLAVAVCTLACRVLDPFLASTNLAMIYLANVIVVALLCGRGPSIAATVLGVAAFDFFFIPPQWTFAVSDTQYLVTFAVMLVTGIVISELTARLRGQSESARRRERHTAALYSFGKELGNLQSREAIAAAVRRTIHEAIDAETWLLVVDDDGSLIALGDPPPAKDEGVAHWAFSHRLPAGAGTNTLPAAEAAYYPLMVADGIVGVLGIRTIASGRLLGVEQSNLLQAFVGQTAAAIERCNLAVKAEEARLQVETEKLRNSLLSAVSHDLRTPLATITGSASLLADATANINSAAKQELAASIFEESERLNQLVANLLDLTRLEAGAIVLDRVLQPIEEVIGVALARMERQLREHPAATTIDDDLPPVPIDGVLIQQVLVNLMDNAEKFSPPGAAIEVRASRRDDHLAVEVADRGPGVPESETTKIFDKFYQTAATTRRGSGIGLAICRGIVVLHGGEIVAENRPGGGALFRFTLPFGATLPQIGNAAITSIPPAAEAVPMSAGHLAEGGVRP